MYIDFLLNRVHFYLFLFESNFKIVINDYSIKNINYFLIKFIFTLKINSHKSRLFDLINNLINTQLIDNEISINNDIKTESECLKSLLNIKQTNLMNQMNQINQNNNFNANPFMLQPNLFINSPIMNINPMIQNDNNPKINIRFIHSSGLNTIITFEQNAKISDLIKEYRKRTNDFEENIFILNGKKLDPFSSSTLKKIMSENLLLGDFFIIVSPIRR